MSTWHSTADDRPGLRPLGRLAQYMNFWQIHKAPPVLVTMDHRAVLVAAWAAQREGLFGNAAPLLLRFDAHLDMGEKPRPWEFDIAQLTDIDAVHAMANDQRHDDGGWVITAMQWGLAGDVVTSFVHDYHRFPGDNDVYEDHRGRRHQLRTCASLAEYMKAGHGHIAPAISLPLWIDIDLDFATRRGEDDSVRAWNSGDWLAEFSPEVTAWFAEQLKGAALVTIATEPEFCGGLSASGTIAKALKEVMAARGSWFVDL